MDIARINELLQPFLLDRSAGAPAVLSELHLQQISMYIDILLKWNARINLTAVRKPDEIVTRHFGESLFAGRHLFSANDQQPTTNRVFDIGSGSGFPGLPIKIWNPSLHATLIESNQKKATFLREVVRLLTLTNIDVITSRAEDCPAGQADTVTLRAVERFETTLPNASRLLKPQGRLALLIGAAQVMTADKIAPHIEWESPIPIPLSANRVVLVGTCG